MSHSIIHFEIPADDPDSLAQFYRELFGWQIDKVPMPGDEGSDAYWIVNTVPVDENGVPQEPGVNGGLTKRVVPEQQPVNYINVESLDEYLAKAIALGATSLVEKMPVPGMGWFAQLRDPQGNMLALWETDESAG